MSKVIVTLKNHQKTMEYTLWYNNVYQTEFKNADGYNQNPNGSLVIQQSVGTGSSKTWKEVALVAAGEWITVCIEEDVAK